MTKLRKERKKDRVMLINKPYEALNFLVQRREKERRKRNTLSND